MTAHPFEHDDAAYVLGALEAQERAAFEVHLATCAECSASVAELRDLPMLLATLSTEEAAAVVAEPLPETLLPGLLRRAAVQRRRQRGVLVGLGSVASACVAALVIVAWPAATPSASHANPVAMTQVVASPVTATVELTAKSWGTAIQVRCHYSATYPGERATYSLVILDRAGVPHSLSSWTLQPGPDKTFPASTALLKTDIKRVEIVYHNKAILSLTT
jgi:anti-sigma-K factor RskA